MPLIVQNSGLMALMPPLLFGSTGYYALLAQFENVAVDCAMRYDKRFKATHRFEIADTHGRINITVPVSRPKGVFNEGSLRWCDITVSDHNHWWSNVLSALESAYGRTPFFEFYIDRLLPLFAPRPLSAEPESLTSLIAHADTAIRKIICPQTKVEYLCGDIQNIPADNTADVRKADFNSFTPRKEYYQVRSRKFGFLPGLSVLDLIFNMGPEAPLVLQSAPAYNHQ